MIHPRGRWIPYLILDVPDRPPRDLFQLSSLIMSNWIIHHLSSIIHHPSYHSIGVHLIDHLGKRQIQPAAPYIVFRTLLGLRRIVSWQILARSSCRREVCHLVRLQVLLFQMQIPPPYLLLPHIRCTGSVPSSPCKKGLSLEHESMRMS